MIKKNVLLLTHLFSILIVLGLIAGLIFSVLFIAGFIIGGKTGADLCHFIASDILPYEYLLAEVTAILGMIKMYLSKEKSFVMDIQIIHNDRNQ